MVAREQQPTTVTSTPQPQRMARRWKVRHGPARRQIRIYTRHWLGTYVLKLALRSILRTNRKTSSKPGRTAICWSSLVPHSFL